MPSPVTGVPAAPTAPWFRKAPSAFRDSESGLCPGSSGVVDVDVFDRGGNRGGSFGGVGLAAVEPGVNDGGGRTRPPAESRRAGGGIRADVDSPVVFVRKGLGGDGSSLKFGESPAPWRAGGCVRA